MDLITPVVRSENAHVYHQYVVRAADRDALVDRLVADGIAAATFYPLPLHLQPCFGYLGYREGDLPHAEEAAKQVLALPIFPEMTDEEVDAVIESVGRNLDVRS